MKKKVKIVLILAVLLIFPLGLNAQDIQVTRFERNYTSMISRMHPANDNTGEGCAVLRCYVRGKGYTIEPNLGVVKTEKLDGEIRLWVPQGTKRLTIRYTGAKPLVGYEIPLRVEAKTDYDVDIDINTNQVGVGSGRSKPKEHNVYIGAGYNIVSVSGPSAALGITVKHHNIELGAVYGLNKTDDLYFYNQSGSVAAGYNYSAIRAYLKYGYEFALSDYFTMTPQAGLAYHAYSGNSVINSNGTSYKSANSMSALFGLRLTVPVSETFKICLTPEYNAAIYKDDNCKVISDNDDTMKNWHTGLNLNVGIMIYF